MNQNIKEAMLYLHIPFCIRKCEYCDFLSFPGGEETRESYVQALIKDMKQTSFDWPGLRVPSIFIGGGTPSVLSGEQIKRIMAVLFASFSIEETAEITMECNPGTVDQEKLVAMREAGINRISFGLQSTKNEELKLLGRIHTYEDFLESFALAREAGFDNINIDIMSALPGQTRESYMQSLKQVLAQKPEHLSAYSLIIEEGTTFYQRYKEDERLRQEGKQPHLLPEEEVERQMYEDTKRILEEQGYHRYEISNYAREGRECRHNKGYWQGTEYLGLGLGASSYIQGERFKRTSEMERYINEDFQKEEVEVLDVISKEEEYFFLGLRMMEGVSKERFLKEFGKTVEEVYGRAVERLAAEGLLTESGDRIALTEAGIGVSNYCLAEFLQ